MSWRVWVISLISLLNFWFWRIFQFNIFLAILSLVNSILLFNLISNESLNPKIKYMLLLISLTLIQAFVIRSDINFRIEDIKPVEILQRHQREFYLAQDLGKLFLNKISLNYYHSSDLFFYKLQRNFFYNLDPNLYFFGNHPRERGHFEFEKYSPIFLPFFIIGLISLLKKGKDLSLIYIALILTISLFIDPAFRLGPLLFFPLINSLVAVGIMKVLPKNEI